MEAGLTKQHVRVSLKSPSEPRGLAFPLVAGWALYPQTLLSTPAASRSQLRLYSADEKSGASGSQPGNTSPSSGTGRIPTQAQALKVAMAQPTLWPGSVAWVKSLVNAGIHLAAHTFSSGMWKPGMEETRAGGVGRGRHPRTYPGTRQSRCVCRERGALQAAGTGGEWGGQESATQTGLHSATWQIKATPATPGLLGQYQPLLSGQSCYKLIHEVMSITHLSALQIPRCYCIQSMPIPQRDTLRPGRGQPLA